MRPFGLQHIVGHDRMTLRARRATITFVVNTTQLVTRARALAAGPGRGLLGITGAPGAGKSSLAVALAEAVPGAVVVPMDGFHRTTADLAARGWVDERGTPRTFDAPGFVALLRRLRAGEAALAPAFDRSLEEPVPDAIEVPVDAPLAIVEGNYLLLETAPWDEIKALLDEVWYVEVSEKVRVERLVARHVEFGRTRAAATERATNGSDAANARLVVATRPRADLVVAL
jgi:pantothenate kinase